MLKWVKLYGTTAADGSLTVTAGMPSHGELHAVEWIDGDLADGVDAVLSVIRDDNAADYTLLTLTNANDDAVYYPRELIDTIAGVEIAGNYAEAIINGYLKLVIASGGNAKTGGCIVYYEA
jgi:hypothetical protein